MFLCTKERLSGVQNFPVLAKQEIREQMSGPDLHVFTLKF